MPSQHTLSERRAHIRALLTTASASGRSLRSVSIDSGIPYATLLYHSKRLAASTLHLPPRAASFVEVSLPTQIPTRYDLSREGITISVPSTTPDTRLRQLIELLRAC